MTEAQLTALSSHMERCEACLRSGRMCPEAKAIEGGDLLELFRLRAARDLPKLSVQIANRLTGVPWDEAEQILAEAALDPTSGVELVYGAMCPTADCGATTEVSADEVREGSGTVEIECHVCCRKSRVRTWVDFRMVTGDDRQRKNG